MRRKTTARGALLKRAAYLSLLKDEELVGLVLKDKPEAYQALVDRYDALVRSVAARYLGKDPMAIEDACQETFLKALARIRDLREASRFKSWLCAIAHNQALDSLRRGRSLVSWDSTGGEEDSPCWEIADAKPNPADRHASDEVAGVMKDILEGIPELYRDPIMLRFEEDLDYREIAELLGKPLGTIKSLIHRGKAMIREELARRAGGAEGALVLAG